MVLPADRDSGAGPMRARFVRKGQRPGARVALLSGTALASAAFCIATSATPALACSPEPCTWTGAQNSSWSQSNNWSNGVPGTGDGVLLTNAGTAPTNHDQSPAYSSVTLNPNAAGYTINGIGSNPIVLQSGGSINDNNTAAGSPGDTLNTGLTLNGPATIMLASGAAGLTFATNPITGTGPLTIVNNSTAAVTFTGIVNTYSGGTTIKGGRLAVDTDFALGASGTRITFDGGTLAFIGGPTGGINRPITLNSAGGTIDTSLGSPTTFVGNIDGSGSLTKIGTGTLELFGNNTYSGPTNINAGTLSVGFDTGLPSTSAVTVNSGATASITDSVHATIGSLADGSAGGGSVLIGVGATGFASKLTVDGPGSSTFSGTITGPGSLEMDGSGSLTLTGTGSHIGGDLTLCSCSTGGLTIRGGSLAVDGSSLGVEVLGGTLAVTNGGTLHVGTSPTPSGSLLVAGGNMLIDGAGSTVTVVGLTGVGILGPGTLTISSGGVLNSQIGAEIDAFVPPSFGISTVTVTGPGSTWNVGGAFGFGLTVGGGSTGGPGVLVIANGAVVNSTTYTTIGDEFNGGSHVLVTGSGSVLNAFNSLAIGGSGCGCGPTFGTLAIADGGVVNSPGTTSIAAGSTLELGIGGLAGTINTPAIASDGQIIANFTDTLTLGAAISGTGTLSKAGSGTLILSGISSYTGATTVNGGILSVTGDISSSSGVTVNSGGTLNGTGIVPNVTVNDGGILAPGLSPSQITISGNLGMASAAIYLIQISPTTASKANVSGSANIGGTVDVFAGPGNYTPGTKYTILTTTGGPVTGTFSGASIVGAPNVRPVLSYDANDVYLNLVQALLPSVPNLSINQQNVLGALNAFINAGGSLPAGFQNLYNLSPSLLAQALTQLEGQNNAGGAQQAGYQLTNEFLLLMLNPFDSDRAGFGGGGFGAGAGQFAPDEDRDLPPDVAAAYAAVTPYYKAPVAPAPKRWNVWAAAFGGSNNTNGNPNGVGSVNFSAQTGAVAAGVDYKLTQDTLIGVALAGGGTSWGLAQGLGSGHSDAFQAGLYGSQRFGAWYVAAAAAFANYWASTTRNLTLPAIDTLNANFNAQSWGGRIEGGYRFAWGTLNLTPYAAFQAQSFSTPNYSEASGSGSNQFALSYASRTGNIERAELGSWLNTLYLLQGNSVVSLFGRAAWAHDWQNTPQASATFLGLSPIAAFIVNGAKPAADLGVVTAGAELRMASGWALMGKFDGEFGSGTQTYAGTARVRYVW
jgi:autotransporter-associated beta strand protein/T5SS/PEP-CTERM-associated repeat protein